MSKESQYIRKSLIESLNSGEDGIYSIQYRTDWLDDLIIWVTIAPKGDGSMYISDYKITPFAQYPPSYYKGVFQKSQDNDDILDIIESVIEDSEDAQYGDVLPSNAESVGVMFAKIINSFINLQDDVRRMTPETMLQRISKDSQFYENTEFFIEHLDETLKDLTLPVFLRRLSKKTKDNLVAFTDEITNIANKNPRFFQVPFSDAIMKYKRAIRKDMEAEFEIGGMEEYMENIYQ